MKDITTIRTVVVDCEQCAREETVESSGPGIGELPEGWMETREGPPFDNAYQFCSAECFLAWHQRDQRERLQEYYDRLRKRQALTNQR